MKGVPERVYIRQHIKTPVMCEEMVSGRLFQGVIHDMSMEGMHLEIDVYLHPGREIELKFHLPIPGSPHQTMIQHHRLKVVWCKEQRRPDPFPYKAGVRRILTEHSQAMIPVSPSGVRRRRRNPFSIY